MNKILIITCLLVFNAVFSQQAEVRKSIETFFTGLNTKDTLTIKSVCHEDMILQSVSEAKTGNRLVKEEKASFLKAIGSIPPGMKIKERILSYDIKTDGDMATAWLPYEFYINGKLSHTGVNSVQLFKDKDTWKIVYIIDTRHVAKQ